MGFAVSEFGFCFSNAFLIELWILFRQIWFLNPYKPGVLLWDIREQDSPRCDAAKRGVPSEAILFAN